jgi:hypothetical protein
MNRSRARFWLGGLVMMLSASYLAVLVFVEAPPGNQRLLDYAAGALMTWGGSIIGFYFGSSSGSSEKDSAIHALATLDERVRR